MKVRILPCEFPTEHRGIDSAASSGGAFSVPQESAERVPRHGFCRRIESNGIAHLVEQQAEDLSVAGSNPAPTPGKVERLEVRILNPDWKSGSLSRHGTGPVRRQPSLSIVTRCFGHATDRCEGAAKPDFAIRRIPQTHVAAVDAAARSRDLPPARGRPLAKAQLIDVSMTAVSA